MPPSARVGRNRWSDLEAAPPPDWAPQLTHSVVGVSSADLVSAQAAAGGADADVLILADGQHVPDSSLVARLLWWQHQCSYAVSIATSSGADAEDWLTRFQRDSDYLDRAGFEAWRGAAFGTLAVPRDLFAAAGGLSAAAGAGWQLELAYRLAQAGAVFVADAEATAPRTAALDVAADLHDVVPLLPERRPDWRQTHAVPMVHVVVDCHAAPEVAAETIDGVLEGEYRDVSVTIVGTANDTSTRSADPRVSSADSVPSSSFPMPFRLEIPAGCVLQPFSIRRMLNRMRESQLGLYQTLVEPQTDGSANSFAIRMLRTAAIERSRTLSGSGSLDDTIDELFGSMWVEGRRFGIRHYSDSSDVSLDPEDAEDEEAGAAAHEDDDAD